MGRHVRDIDPTRRRRLALVSVVGSFAVVVSSTVLSAQAQDDAVVDPWGAAELVVNGGFEDGTRGWRTNDAERQQLGVRTTRSRPRRRRGSRAARARAPWS